MSFGLASKRNVDSKRATNEWIRPADWLALPALATTYQKFVGLVAVYPDSNFVALTAAAAYTVDWGDGTTTNYDSGTQANHTYDYATISSGTLTSRGYRQAIVTVTPQTGNLTSLNLNVKNAQTGLKDGTGTLWLDISVASTNLTNLSIGGSALSQNLSATHPFLEQISVVSHAATSAAYMFRNCFALQSLSIPAGSSFTACTNMFEECGRLQVAPMFKTTSCTNMSYMFYNCHSLIKIPLYDSSSVTTFQYMFNGCSSLASIPAIVTSSVTGSGFYAMFQGCTNLKTVPLLSFGSATAVGQMFAFCYSLSSIPSFVTTSITNTSGMFQYCHSLESIPLLDTSHVTDVSQMFSGCCSLWSIPALDTSLATNAVNIVSSAGTFARNYFALASVGPLNCVSFTSGQAPSFNTSDSFTGGNITSIVLNGIKFSFGVTYQRLSKTALLALFSGLGSGAGTQTISITGNWGADTAVSKTSCGTTSGSTTVTQSNTSNLAIGQRVTGTGISTAVAVTTQDSGDTVTRANHGLANGTLVSFASISATTGITVYTTYYVVNATTNTFQVATSVGGSALPLTTDGSGTILYPSYITNIVTNTNFTLSAPASATGTVTLSARVLDTSIAILKGWTVSG